MDKYAAIIISEDHYNAMGMLRSLKASGLPLKLILMADHDTYVDKSRYLAEAVVIKKSKEAIISTLAEMMHSDEHSILFPLSDFAANVLDEYHDSMPKNVTFPHMNGKMLSMLDKEKAKQHAQHCGLRTAQGMTVDLHTQEPCNLGWNCFPAIVKPLASIEGAKGDIQIAEDDRQLGEILSSLHKVGYTRVMVEQYICGESAHMVEVMGYVANGETVICGIIRKVREYPIKNGSTSYAAVVEEHADIQQEKIKEFISNTGFEGLFDMEFKYADGKAYFIECNFRNGAPGYALTNCGRNVPCGWMQRRLSIPYKERKRKNKLFMCEQNDVINMLKGEVPLLTWLHQFFRAKKIFFDSRDMRPYMHYYRLFLKSVSKKMVKGD